AGWPHGVSVLYAYKAIDASGRSVLGRADAANLHDLEQRVRRMGLGRVVAAAARGRSASAAHASMRREDRIHFCFHLEQLIAAGIPILDALGDLRDSAESRGLRALIASLAAAVEGGQTLSQPLAEQPEAFGKVFVGLV